MPEQIMSTCLKVEGGNVVADDEIETYKTFIGQGDDVVNKGAKAAFSIFMSLAQAEAVGELRRGSSGNSEENTESPFASNDTDLVDSNARCEPHDTPGIFVVAGKVLLSFMAGYLLGQYAFFPVAAITGMFFALIGMIIYESVTGAVVGQAGWTFIGFGLMGAAGVSLLAAVATIGFTYHYLTPNQVDCYGGEVQGASCVAGMKYGESVTVQCKAGGEVTVTCTKANAGAMTASGSCKTGMAAVEMA